MRNYTISLAAVNVPEETYLMMMKALREGKIGQSELIAEFEQSIAEYVGAQYCIAVSSGTMADAVAVSALKQKYGHFGNVIVPALTFIAQPNSVRYNELQVVFADVKENWMMNLDKLEIDPFDNLIFGTDLMGRQYLGEMDIEDACESFGSRMNGKYSGTFGRMGTYSFFPSHTISTGEGGAIVTNDPELDKMCRSVRAHGVGSTEPKDKFHFPNFGFNARMTSLQAVLGICLMKYIGFYVSKRRENFRVMKSILGGFDERIGEEIVPHGYPVEFASEELRDAALENILNAGIECRKFFSCIPLEEPPHFSSGKFPVAIHISHTHLYIPCHQNLSNDDVNYACKVVMNQRGFIKKT